MCFAAVSFDQQNVIYVNVCRSYTSSFDFSNSRLHLQDPLRVSVSTTQRRSVSSSIAACTQTSHHDDEFPRWIEYHRSLGIGHFYIYDHAPFNITRLHKTLRSEIDRDLVTIVPWHVEHWQGFQRSPNQSDWIAHQIWSQNDCIHRYGSLHTWMLISDVDEFVVPMGSNRNFEQVLDIPPQYCALQLLNYFFYNDESRKPVVEAPPKDRPSESRERQNILPLNQHDHSHRTKMYSLTSRLGKYILRPLEHKPRDTHSKNFVRPKLIHYFAVHQVMTSVNNAPILYANVTTHARLHHYRGGSISESSRSNYTVDTHIWPFLDLMKNESKSAT